MPLDMHPLVCYSINTVVLTATQCSFLFQKTKEFNNSIDTVCQNTVKKYGSSKLLNSEESMLFFNVFKSNFPDHTTLWSFILCFFYCSVYLGFSPNDVKHSSRQDGLW